MCYKSLIDDREMEQIIATFIEGMIDALLKHSRDSYNDMEGSFQSLRMFSTSTFKEFDYKGFNKAIRGIRDDHVDYSGYQCLAKDINNLFFPLLQEVEAYYVEN